MSRFYVHMSFKLVMGKRDVDTEVVLYRSFLNFVKFYKLNGFQIPFSLDKFFFLFAFSRTILLFLVC